MTPATSSGAASGPTELARRLPDDFVLGASTASYQIEGAVDEDGRGPTVWDTFCARPGTIVDGSSGAVACDHYHRLDEDVALMRDLGIGGYRFSMAWSRVLPTGTGTVNEAGLDFYDRLVDALLAAEVRPMATLFHWDLPQALQDQGGWLRRETVDAFGEYAAVVADRLADRVAWWCPVNEPNVVTVLGHALGAHAPGERLLFDALPVAHHLNLAHGVAVEALREAHAQAVGAANNHSPIWPLSDAADDVEGAGLYDAIWNRLFADPMLLGRYPEELVGLLPVQDGDLELIRQPLDFYGFNYYNPTLVGAAGKRPAVEVPGPDLFGDADLPFSIHPIAGYPLTDFGWPVVPAGLTELMVQLRDRYPDLPPLYVTENGCSYGMGPDEQGVVDDQPRIDYYDGHLRAVADAVDAGVDVAGYFAWSLMDNFEWAEGYTQRFGLTHVDYDTLARTPKRSFGWYADLSRARRP